MKNKFNSESLRPFINMAGLTGKEEVDRKQYTSDIQVSPDEEKTIVARISTMDEDADGDVVIPSGADLRRFLLNPIIHKDHDYKIDSVVGKALEIGIDERGVVAKIKFADTPAANDCWQLVKNRFVNANSIGFICKEVLHRGTKEFDTFIKQKSLQVSNMVKRIVTKWELIESSIVSVPCDPYALIQAISAKSIELSEKTIKELDLPKKDRTEIFTQSVLDIVDKVYPNYHAFRINDPSKYTSFRYGKDALGDGVDAIYGVKEGKSEVQAVRFDAAKWTYSAAKNWIKEHNYKPIEETEASNPEKAVTEEVVEIEVEEVKPTIVAEVISEVKPEVKVEPVKEEVKPEVKPEPVEEEVWNVIRVGGAKVDKSLVAEILSGKIV